MIVDSKSCNASCSHDKNNTKPNLIFLGAPGAGKGSIASVLVKEYEYFQLSTGDMFRSEIKNQTELGLQIKAVLDSGGYVDNSLTNKLVEQRLTSLVEQEQAFILDGYPRTIEQADFLRTLEQKNIKIDKVIFLKITKDQVIDRLSKRRICPNCKTIFHLESHPPRENKYCTKCGSEVIKRPDDEPQVIEKRLSVYEKETQILIDYYKKIGNLIEIDSFQEFPKVYADVKKALGWSS
ncbi:adenylate kinase [Mycoplasma struthionis]|uniref:Adenylate kinase n=1 Tax=Mycoplasma struthionis TaxID=538220 RepID=A0A3G8LGF1_9MOLU|nr:adenylate kinase [Mycoplasma struthionis]AZG68749.1 adenylate kinase [Mycoplasma struthionis]TPI01867.1 adenylate kinase [Mycoplasma struthionis]